MPSPSAASMADTSTRGGAGIAFSEPAYVNPIMGIQSPLPDTTVIHFAALPTHTYQRNGSGSSTTPSLGEVEIHEPLDCGSTPSDSFGGSKFPPHLRYAKPPIDVRQLGSPNVATNLFRFNRPRNNTNVDSCSTSIPSISELTTEPSLADNMSTQHKFASSSSEAEFRQLPVSSPVSNFSNFNGGGEVSPPYQISSLWQANDSSIGWAGNGNFHLISRAACVGPHAFFSSTSPSCSFEDASHERSPVLSEDLTFSHFKDNDSSLVSSSNVCHKYEKTAQGTRRIAPKLSGYDPAVSKTPLVLKRIREDGTSKEVIAIQKTPYIRPTYPKKICFLCKDHPDGFRGEHELRRHHERAHSTRKKMWMTIDVSGTNWLGRCKACSGGKKYGAYYNAAAHLRRAHFNPRRRGRGVDKYEEKRGGKGGGDYPPMDVLKKNWLKEVDVIVPNNYIENSEEEDFDTEDSPSILPLQCSTPDLFDFDSPAAPIEQGYSFCPDDIITTQTLPSYHPPPTAFTSYSHQNHLYSQSMRALHESIGDVTTTNFLRANNQRQIMDLDAQYESYLTASRNDYLPQEESTMFNDTDLWFTMRQ